MVKGRHFNRAVILLCVRWYLANNLSLKQSECPHRTGKQDAPEGQEFPHLTLAVSKRGRQYNITVLGPMRRFVEGVDRGQTTLFPGSLDDWIGEDNPVRVIDAFVDALDLRALARSEGTRP